jgi:hypothetical protein
MQLPQAGLGRDNHRAAIDKSDRTFHGGMAEDDLATQATLEAVAIGVERQGMKVHALSTAAHFDACREPVRLGDVAPLREPAASGVERFFVEEYVDIAVISRLLPDQSIYCPATVDLMDDAMLLQPVDDSHYLGRRCAVIYHFSNHHDPSLFDRAALDPRQQKLSAGPSA